MNHSIEPPRSDPRSLVQSFYAALARSDAPALIGCMSPDIHWTEPERFPVCGGTWIGVQAVVDNVFKSLASDWRGFSAHPQVFIAEGDRVVVLGDYAGTHCQTGIAMTAPFVHVWTVGDGRLNRFSMYTDTAKVLEATRSPTPADDIHPAAR